MKKILFILLQLTLIVSLSSDAQELYMTAKGNSQGVFEGEVTRKGQEKKIELRSYQFDLSYNNSGTIRLGNSRTTKSSFIFTKNFDFSSLNFFTALNNGEVLPVVTIEVFSPSSQANTGSGTMALLLRIELNDVTVNSFRQIVADDAPGNTNTTKPIDEIKLLYKTMKLTHVSKNVTVVGD